MCEQQRGFFFSFYCGVCLELFRIAFVIVCMSRAEGEGGDRKKDKRINYYLFHSYFLSGTRCVVNGYKSAWSSSGCVIFIASLWIKKVESHDSHTLSLVFFLVCFFPSFLSIWVSLSPIIFVWHPQSQVFLSSLFNFSFSKMTLLKRKSQLFDSPPIPMTMMNNLFVHFGFSSSFFFFFWLILQILSTNRIGGWPYFYHFCKGYPSPFPFSTLFLLRCSTVRVIVLDCDHAKTSWA